MSTPDALGFGPGNPDASLRRHIRRTIRLAVPVIASRVGMITLLTVDVMVLGHTESRQLADYVLGQSLVDSLIAMLAGLLLGVPVLIARETGRGNDQGAGQILWRGLVYAVGVGLIVCVALQFAEPIYRLTGQSADIAARGADVTAMLAYSMPFFAVMLVCVMFLEALHRPLVGTVAMAGANLVNLAANLVFVPGWGPIPAMGAVGCALATVCTSAFLAIGLLAYLRVGLPGRHRYGLDRPPGRDLWSAAGEQRKVGYAAGASYALEASSFAALTLVIGVLGELALSTHGVLFQFLALPFMVSFGVAAATQVRVGNAWGRGDPVGMRLAGWVGFALSVTMSVIATVFLLSFPEPLIGLFSDDPAVLVAAVPVMLWVALSLIFDGGQSVLNHACRGRGDTWVPTACHFTSYWLVLVPLAIVLAHPMGLGVLGVYQAIAISSVVSLGALMIRFYWLGR